MSRPLLFAAGALALALVWLAPFLAPPSHGFTLHMIRHLLLVAVAGPLLAFALNGTAFDPIDRLPAWLVAPIALSVLEFLIVWGWHAPALHTAARHSPWLVVLEQSSFLMIGLLLWLSVLGGGARAAENQASGVIALLLTSMHMTLLGVLLVLAPRPLYDHAGSVCVALETALEDQRIGGILMLLVGGVVYLAGGLHLVSRLLRADGSPSAPGLSPLLGLRHADRD